MVSGLKSPKKMEEHIMSYFLGQKGKQHASCTRHFPAFPSQHCFLDAVAFIKNKKKRERMNVPNILAFLILA